MKIIGKVALITGGASGFGKSVVAKLLEKNIKFIAVLDSDKENGQKVCGEFSNNFGADRVKFIPCDVTKEDQLKNAFQEAYDVHQTLDIVINNAGIVSEDNQRTIDVNLTAVMNGMLLAHDLLTKKKREEKGVIINTASMAGLRPSPVVNLSYTGSKFGVVGLTKAYPVCSDDFGQDIRAVAVCPAAALETSFWTNNNFGTDDIKARLSEWKHNHVSVSMVTAAFIQAIEDDQLNGALLKARKDGIEVEM